RGIENVIGGGGVDRSAERREGKERRGGGSTDFLNGGLGIDTADYSDKTRGVVVTLNGNALANVTVAGVMEDRIRGIENVIGGGGVDVLTGDQNDNLLRGGGSTDFLNGGLGIDTADYSDKTRGVVVTLNSNALAVVAVAGLLEASIRGIENVIGGGGVD